MTVKVAMIGSRGFPGQGGGVERVLESVTPRIVHTGRADIWVYCADYVDYEGDDFHGVQLRRLPSVRSKYGDTFTRSLLATLRELRGEADVVHFHSIGSAPLAWMPRLFGRRVVLTVHGLDWQRSKWNRIGRAFLRFGEWTAMRFPHETIVVSEELKAELEARHGRPTTFITNGAEPRTSVPVSIIRERWGLEPGSYVLFLGRLVPEKGAHTLIEAFRQLADPDVKLVIAGPAWFEGTYNEELRSLAAGDDRIVFTGEVDEPPLQELYANCSCFVLPSEIEGMSLALLDGLAFGCAIVTSDIPENANLVGDAALTFPTGDADALADRLERILSDGSLADSLRASAARRAADSFDWDKIAEQWLAVYERVARR